MPWCPVCKNEYKEGIKICADCKVKLVAELSSEKGQVLVCDGATPMIERIAEYLNYSNIKAKVKDCGETAKIYVAPKNEDIAKRAIGIFMTQEQNRMREQLMAAQLDKNVEMKVLDSLDPEEDKKEEKPAKEEPARVERKALSMKNKGNSVYKDNAEKAEDFKSSGVILLVVGVLGIIVMVLIDLGILKFSFGNLILTNILMNALFILFIVFGIYSLKGAKKYASEADEEKNLTKEIKAWAAENLKAEEVDAISGCEEGEEEEFLYFKRYAFLRHVISEKFVNLEESYLEFLTESIYQKLYEEDEE